MPSHIKKNHNEKGIALVTAILACVILFALAMLVIHLSTGDLRVSAKMSGEKKAAIAAEAGIHSLIQNLDPENLASASRSRVPIDSATDPNSVYSVSTPSTPTVGPTFVPMTGYSIGGGQSWGYRVYEATVTGEHLSYNTRVDIDIGVGHGPVEITTMSR
jgi:Tfp pilus assembly protein PilX